jgi:hypothetical protein
MSDIKEDLTPPHLRCSVGACPAVLRLSNGNLLIIGTKLSAELMEQVGARIGKDEIGIQISPEFFSRLLE